jgi:sn-glycerol 3-phosphate transport system ATP-binding protein
MSVYKNMAYGLKIRRMAKADIDRRVRDTAQILELSELLERKPSQLSGGQRQRVAMGRCIVREPKVFLFDEPLSNLDAKLRVQMRLEIRKLHETLKITSVFVTHDQVEAMTLGDRLIVMENGHTAQIGSPLDVYQRPANRFVAGFIGSPAMNFFDARLSADGRQVRLPDGTSLPLPAAGLPDSGNREVILGIRPEHFDPVTEATAALQLNVDHVELLGADTLVYGHLGGEKTSVTVRMPGVRHLSRNARLPVKVPADKLHLFDRQSRQRFGPG